MALIYLRGTEFHIDDNLADKVLHANTPENLKPWGIWAPKGQAAQAAEQQTPQPSFIEFTIDQAEMAKVVAEAMSQDGAKPDAVDSVRNSLIKAFMGAWSANHGRGSQWTDRDQEAFDDLLAWYDIGASL